MIGSGLRNTTIVTTEGKDVLGLQSLSMQGLAYCNPHNAICHTQYIDVCSLLNVLYSTILLVMHAIYCTYCLEVVYPTSLTYTEYHAGIK